MFETYHLVNVHFPWFFQLFAFLFGACIGSFLNVCIYRIPNEESVVFPGSHCSCGKPIRWYDNIPILSWLILRGKARCCGQRFSFRYAFVELLTASLFLLCWVLFPPTKALCGMIFCAILIAGSFIDLDHMIIPDRFTIGGFVVGVGLSFAFPALHGQTGSGIYALDSVRSMIISLQGAFIGSALLLWIALLAESILRKEAMGFGDVKLLGAIGAFCGWQGAVAAIFGGAMIGTVAVILYLPFMLLKKNQHGGEEQTIDEADTSGADTISTDSSENEEEEEDAGESFQIFGRQVPYGPLLSMGSLLYLFYLHKPVDAYFAEIANVLF